MDVLVVGAGSMGRWFGRAVGPLAERVAYADVDPAAAEDAAAATTGGAGAHEAETGAGGTAGAESDEAASDPSAGGGVPARAVPLDGEESFDVVCLAVPISAVGAAVDAQAGRAEQALVDVTGVMAGPVAAMAAAAPDRERVSFHPLFAPENEPGNVAVVPDAPGPVTDRIRDALADRGNRLFETTPAEHDEAMEAVQAGAHAAVLAYALATDRVREEFHTPVSAGLADLVEQVADGSPAVYAEIQGAFEGAEAVADAARRIADADRGEFEDLFAAARDRPTVADDEDR